MSLNAERDAEIVRLYVEDGLLARQIATKTGLSTPRVLQILSRAGVEMRGRRKSVTREDCDSSLGAFVADGGTTVRGYEEWRKGNPWAVSLGTLRNFGYDFTSIPNKPVVRYEASDVMMPEAKRPSCTPIANWLYQNSAETASSIYRHLGGRRNLEPMAARPRGPITWSLTYYDAICPDQSGARGYGRPRPQADDARVVAVSDRGDRLTVKMQHRNTAKMVTIPRAMAPLLRDEIDRWLAS